MQPPSLHSNFFSSLKQVEKRLKLENPSLLPASSSPSPPPPTVETNGSLVESLSSPLYLNFDRPNSSSNNNSSSSSLQDSEPPREFLSNSLDFPPTHEDTFPSKGLLQHPQTTNEVQDNGVDDVGLLIQLLGLSDGEAEKEEERVCLGLKNCGGACGFECGFYAKIVGVKGPKCEKEVQRLNGWIKHFLNGGGGEGRREPLRLAHLLLGKAAFLSEGSDCFGGFEFPSTIQEFLQNDPPQD